MDTLIYSVAIVTGLGLILGLVLALADRYISVPRDEREEKILAQLSGANCGSCGYAGCASMAKALAQGKANIASCPVASNEARAIISQITGNEQTGHNPQVAFVACSGGIRCADKTIYDGLQDCRTVAATATKGCAYGCLGFMSCASVCPEQAIIKNQYGAAQVIAEKCISCGKCVKTCPRSLIKMQPLSAKIRLSCNTLDKGKAVREVCSVGCIGCGLCAKVCPEHAIAMENNRPIINNELCSGCGSCREKCPQRSLQ